MTEQKNNKNIEDRLREIVGYSEDQPEQKPKKKGFENSLRELKKKIELPPVSLEEFKSFLYDQRKKSIEYNFAVPKRVYEMPISLFRELDEWDDFKKEFYKLSARTLFNNLGKEEAKRFLENIEENEHKPKIIQLVEKYEVEKPFEVSNEDLIKRIIKVIGEELHYSRFRIQDKSVPLEKLEVDKIIELGLKANETRWASFLSFYGSEFLYKDIADLQIRLGKNDEAEKTLDKGFQVAKGKYDYDEWSAGERALSDIAILYTKIGLREKAEIAAENIMNNYIRDDSILGYYRALKYKLKAYLKIIESYADAKLFAESKNRLEYVRDTIEEAQEGRLDIVNWKIRRQLDFFESCSKMLKKLSENE